MLERRGNKVPSIIFKENIILSLHGGLPMRYGQGFSHRERLKWRRNRVGEIGFRFGDAGFCPSLHGMKEAKRCRWRGTSRTGGDGMSRVAFEG